MTSNKKEKIEIPIMSDIIEVTIISGILYIYTYTSIWVRMQEELHHVKNSISTYISGWNHHFANEFGHSPEFST
jgi:hypothetical protein